LCRDDVIEKLREHEAELRAAGVVHLRLHGSYARQTQVEALSDVDLIAEFEPMGLTRFRGHFPKGDDDVDQPHRI
jgi:predicted nucleotidyltransferase